MTGCDHKFVDTNYCLKCGWVPPPRQKRAQAQASAQQLMALGNRIQWLRDNPTGDRLTVDELCIIGWALGIAHAHVETWGRRPDDGRDTHVLLHEAVDILLAQFIIENPGHLPSETSIIDLLHWSNVRLMKEGKLDELAARAKAEAGT